MNDYACLENWWAKKLRALISTDIGVFGLFGQKKGLDSEWAKFQDRIGQVGIGQ